MNSTNSYDLVIVGAGPAGLSAAITAADHGLRVVVVDEQHDMGGQVFRQSPRTFKAKPNSALKTYPFGVDLLTKARDDHRIEWRFGATAWGVFSEDKNDQATKLAVSTGEESNLIAGSKLLIATGAYDLPVAFPGWTLPGVMSAGGVQTFIKSQHIHPGSRYVLAGSHPLLLVLAEQLVEAGATVLEVAIARPMPKAGELLSHVKAIPGHMRLMFQLAKSLLTLKRARVPIRFGTMILRAEGEGALKRTVLCDVDKDWHPIAGTEREFETDCLAIGYGLLASTELARQAGCDVHWSPNEGGWIVKHDTGMRTNVKSVLVAGEPAGVGGAQLAYQEGCLAALTVVHDALADSASNSASSIDSVRREISSVQSSIRKTRRFTDSVLTFFAPRLDSLSRLAVNDTLVCRCEEVSANTVHEFVNNHSHVSDVNSVKLACRTGMGYCQGRYCQHTTAHLLADARALPVSRLGVFRAQAPVKPVSVKSIANLKL